MTHKFQIGDLVSVNITLFNGPTWYSIGFITNVHASVKSYRVYIGDNKLGKHEIWVSDFRLIKLT